MELIYLACPYSHPFSREVEAARYELATRAAAYLARTTDCTVFSPITHSHPINLAIYHQDRSAAKGYDYWLSIDFKIVDIADWFYILQLDGWETAHGIKRELKRFLCRKSLTYVKYISHKIFDEMQ